MKGLIYVGATAIALFGAQAIEAQGPGAPPAGGGGAGRGGGPGGAAAPQQTLQDRIVAVNSANFRTSNSVHAGAGPMAFGTVLGGGAIPGLGFIHRGQIPPGGGIGVHFHLSSEEMFVILNEGEAQFTINGRTSLVQTPAGVPVQLGNSHALVNSSSGTLEWLNIAVQAQPAYAGGSIDLNDTRVGAPLDPIPNFLVMRLTPPTGAGNAQHGADNTVQYRRALNPAVFRTPWTYVDHMVIPAGGATQPHLNLHLSKVYYVLRGQGTVRVNGEEATFSGETAIPIRAKEVNSLRNTGTGPLELLIIGIADDMAKDTETIVIQ